MVILCSHFERYLRSANEEAVALLNESQVQSQLLPERLRLQHSRMAIDELANTEWTRRSGNLQHFVQMEAWLWGNAEKGPLEHGRIMQWMKTPDPREVIRFYHLWGFNDVFGRITRRSHTRRQFFLKLTELVEKRNNIAHGDFSTEATAGEVREYQRTVAMFCDRVDRHLARKLRVSFGLHCNWN